MQVYCPYVVFNKTGLDFALKSKAPFSSPKNAAGQDIFSGELDRRSPVKMNIG